MKTDISEIENKQPLPQKILDQNPNLFENITLKAKPRLFKKEVQYFFKKHKRVLQNKHNFANKFENLAIKVSFLRRT